MDPESTSIVARVSLNEKEFRHSFLIKLVEFLSENCLRRGTKNHVQGRIRV